MKNLARLIFFLSTSALVIACEGEKNKKEMEVIPVISDARTMIENAHNKSGFLEQNAIRFDLKLSFRGKKRLFGKLTLATNSSAGKIEYDNGDILLYNPEGIYHSDSMTSDSKLKFTAYTWSYFFLFPYKISDPGANWKPIDLSSLEGHDQNTYELTFDPGIGEAPDDWYKLYVDKKTNLIHVGAYIVTANKTREEAEVDPHAIEYKIYKNIKGIPIAHNWSFWEWRADRGLTAKLGEAILENVEFVELNNDYFEPSNELIKIPSK